MPNKSLSAALKEVYAMGSPDDMELPTLAISHPSLDDVIYMVQDRRAWDMKLETGELVTFEPVPFRFTTPSSGTNGIQELMIAIDNVDRRIFDFMESVKTLQRPIEVSFRSYLKSDLEKPQTDPPLVLYLTEVTTDAFEVKGKATFAGVVNMPNLTEYYDRSRFPGLS